MGTAFFVIGCGKERPIVLQLSKNNFDLGPRRGLNRRARSFNAFEEQVINTRTQAQGPNPRVVFPGAIPNIHAAEYNRITGVSKIEITHPVPQCQI